MDELGWIPSRSPGSRVIFQFGQKVGGTNDPDGKFLRWIVEVPVAAHDGVGAGGEGEFHQIVVLRVFETTLDFPFLRERRCVAYTANRWGNRLFRQITAELRPSENVPYLLGQGLGDDHLIPTAFGERKQPRGSSIRG